MGKFTISLVIVFLIIFSANGYCAVKNELLVSISNTSSPKPGYIDKATITVEPHGSYVEQSLYIEYSDHNQFQYQTKIEIIHRFELPKGAVVNDLWLWIDGKVMQARILKVWTAQRIYDSIVVARRDPALLTKKGDQYELRIFPLTGGGKRKIKLNFISPTLWSGNQASAELPYKFLNANNSTVKPAEILFRTPQNIWGTPSVTEFPDKGFTQLKDTMNYSYRYLLLDNIANKNKLSLLFQTNFKNGYFYGCSEVKNDYTYYQLGILPGQFFDVKPNTESKKILLGLDMSGPSNSNYDKIFPNLKRIMKSALKANDTFNIIISGAGAYKNILEKGIIASPENIDSVCLLIAQTKIADTLKNSRLMKLLFCDLWAEKCWGFPSLKFYAAAKTTQTFDDAIDSITSNDVVAAYSYGYEYPLDEQTAVQAKLKVDTLLSLGGRFVTYYDNNREGRESIASKYIKGLSVYSVYRDKVTLSRNSAGNIGRYFPEKFEKSTAYVLDYNDPDVKKEVVDASGRPVVISKRINNGLLVVSGLWAFGDEASLKTSQSIPLLGLYKNLYPIQYFNLLNQMQLNYSTFKFDKGIILSSADSVVNKEDADSYVKSYLTGYGSNTPVFTTINLIDSTGLVPRFINIDGVDYYGSGYLMKSLSTASNGAHYAVNQVSWDYIANAMSVNSIPALQSHSLTVTPDNGTARVVESKEVNPDENDPYKPVFFIGSTTAKNTMAFEVTARFEGIADSKIKTITMPVYHDSTLAEIVIPSMLAQENLNVLFNKTPPYDTAKILSTAYNAHLLCDYTALLALEPNDTIKFIDRPFDESGLTPVELVSFLASVNADRVTLMWSTATEKNNYGFEIERCVDNIWSKIGFVNGKGTTAEIQYYSFVDKNLKHGKYSYRLKQIDFDGTVNYYYQKETVEIGIPAAYSLAQNYPNPFNPVTTINYSIPVEGKVKLVVYNSLGQAIKELVNEVKSAGSHSVQFNAEMCSSGVYVYTLTAGSFQASKKLIITK